MKQAYGRLMRRGRDMSERIFVSYEGSELPDGAMGVRGEFVIPRGLHFDREPYDLFLEDGQRGEMIIVTIESRRRGIRKAGFIGTLAKPDPYDA